MSLSLSNPIRIRSDAVELEGMLQWPPLTAPPTRGIVLFAHGSGSSRFSPRNTMVAKSLREVGIATLLIDLLTHEEADKEIKRFDITLLTHRLQAASEWLSNDSSTHELPLGLFGASTGGAAALQVAAARASTVRAVVLRGGRPDLAGWRTLKKVEAPTLLIVAGDDDVVLRLNKAAYEILHSVKHLETVPGATHLFEEPGALESVADLARDWFARYLVNPANREPVATV